MVQSVQRPDTSLTAWGSIPGRSRFPLHSFQTGTMVKLAHSLVCIRGSLHGDKAAGA
jgi:hypothetical protein